MAQRLQLDVETDEAGEKSYWIGSGENWNQVPLELFVTMQRQQDEVRSQSGFEQAARGFGQSSSRLINAGRQAFNYVTGDDAELAELQGARRDQEQQDWAQDVFQGVAGDVGGFMPSMATAFIPGGLPAQVGIGTAQGALENPENPGMGAAFGAGGTLAGGAIGGMANRIARNIKGMAGRTMGAKGLHASQAETLRLGEEAGLNFTPGQKSGRAGQLRLEDSLKKNPAFAHIDEARRRANTEQLNNLAADRLRIPRTGKMTGEQQAEVVDRVKGAYKDAALATEGAELDPVHLIEFEDNLTEAGAAFFKRFNARFPKMAEGNKMTGAEFNQARNWLSKQSNANANIVAGVSDEIHELMGIVDDTLEAANPDVAGALQAARSDWRALKIVEASQRGAQTSAQGNISPAAAYNHLVRYDKGGFLRGRKTDDPFYNAIKAMAATGDLADSGTPTGMYMNQGIMQRAGNALINAPLAEDYMAGDKLSGMMLGLMEETTRSTGARAAGIAAARGLQHGMTRDEQAQVMP